MTSRATGVRSARRRRWSAAEKAEALQQFATSGLGPSAFCREWGLPRVTFGRWRCDAVAASGFARVRLRSSPPIAVARRAAPAMTLVLRWSTGPAAEFTGLDAETLATVLQTLDALARDAGSRSREADA